MTEFAPLDPEGGGRTNLFYRAIALGGTPPPCAKTAPPGGAQSVAYQFMDRHTGGRLLVAPDVGGLNDGLLEGLASSDAVLFDGTFWSGDELQGVKSNAPEAVEMGHVTIKDCSLGLLGQLAAGR
jgi:pyrroloquinoline quinone biosynthesis protein B